MIVEPKTATEYIETLSDAYVAQVIPPEDTDAYLVPDGLSKAAGPEGVAVLYDEEPNRLLSVMLSLPKVGYAFQPFRHVDAYPVALADLPRGVSEGDRLSVAITPALVDGLEERGRYVDADILLWDVREWSV